MPPRPRSILTRLMLLVLVAALVPAAALITGSFYVGASAREDMERRIDQTLNLAINLEKSIIDGRLMRVRDRALALAGNQAVVAQATAGTAPKDELVRAKANFPVADMLTVVDAGGRVLARAHADSAGDVINYNGLIAQVVESKQAAAAAERIPAPELADEGAQIINQVRVSVVPTDLSTDPRAGSELEDALALVGVAPILAGPDQTVVGAVIVADVLNNDFTIVDEVTRLAPLGMPVNATIALDAVRVTTNVPAQAGGRRAIGTLYSDPVMAKIRTGDEYRGRALVGGWQWQRTIYIPMMDHRGQVVASPYVGVDEAYFTALAQRANLTTWIGVGIAVVSLGVTLFLAYILAQSRIIGPIRQFTQVLQAGNVYTTVSPEGADEISDLADALNSMIGRVRKSLTDVNRISGGLKSVIDTLGLHAGTTAEGARHALTSVESALKTAEQVGAGAQFASSRARELEMAITRVSAGADEQARAVQHVSWVTDQVTTAYRVSREMITTVINPARAVLVAAQEGRQSALKALTALERLRLNEAEPSVEELDRCQALAREVDDTLRRISQSAEQSLDGLWDLAAVLHENGARVAAISQQVEDVSKVVGTTTQTTQTMGAASREIMQQVEAMTTATGESVDRVQSVQEQLSRIADSHQALQQLAERLEELSRELDQVTGQFPES